MIFLKSNRKKSEALIDLDAYVNDGSVKTSTKMKNMLMMKSKKKKKSLNIFRRKSTSTKTDGDSPLTRPGLTWTNSDDSSFSGDSAFTTGGSTSEIHGNSSTLLLMPSPSVSNFNTNKSHGGDATKKMEFLVEKYKTDVEEKQVEIELMQDQIVVLNEKNMEKDLIMDSMKEQHKLAIHEKTMEMKSMESRMVIMTNQHEEEIEILEAAIQEKESEIIDLTAKLNCTKADLFEVSSTLIQTQHELHDMSNAWPFKFFL